LITVFLVAPIFFLPKLLDLVGYFAKNRSLFFELVKNPVIPHPSFSKFISWILRPVQGIALSMIFAERFLSLLEYSVTGSSASLVVRSALFIIGSALVSLFLGVVWTLDDLGIKIYNQKTGELHMVGSSVGTILPLISGVIGITSICFRCSVEDAVVNLLEIVMILYSPFVLFVVIHEYFVERRRDILSKRLSLREIETRLK